MSKMNWEHRNRMGKVWSYPPAPPAKLRKKKKAKRKRTDPENKHVCLESKYEGKCKSCTRRVEIGDKVFWNPAKKYVVHSYCFEDFMRDGNT